jgi:sulfatase maturation enzyme AslB (radical SAM superfamily)
MDTQTSFWQTTPGGEARGYIQPHVLRELWFHTGTACNLACPFCLEGSKPGDDRLNRITLADIEKLMITADRMGVEQFSFTGGEPFIVKDFVNILTFAANLKPCLVLTNGTDALLKRIHQLDELRTAKHPVSFRISIDWPDEQRHDAGRGAGTFRESLESLVRLEAMGFHVSLARQSEPDEDVAAVDAQFQTLLRDAGLKGELRVVSFPDFATPGQDREVPAITEDCMTRYHTEVTRQQFMCAFSKMVVKQNGRMRIYACTLVDDDLRYDLGEDLEAAMTERILLAHHRCYSCFAYGSSCSEL